MGQPFLARSGLPPLVILGAAGLSILAALAGNPAGGSKTGQGAPIDALRLVELQFADRTDGGVDVIDAATGSAIDTIRPGEGGFVRATMRGLASERKRTGVPLAPPFHLYETAAGHLILRDPETGRLVALDAFGRTNAGAFEAFLGNSTNRAGETLAAVEAAPVNSGGLR
jgi:putative photosynthetic complex assembly protein